MRILQQSTSVDLPIGPFVDQTDGFTAETALTITQPDIRLKKNAAAWAQKNAAQTLTHEENGNYEVTLDATDTDTLGQLRLHVNESGALPVWDDFLVVPADVYNALVNGSGNGVRSNVISLAGSAISQSGGLINANVTQLSGDATAADNSEAFFDGTGYAGTGNTIPTVTSVTNAVNANVTQISGDTTAADNLELAYDFTAGAVPSHGIVDQGTAQAATGTTLQLRSAAAFANDEINGCFVYIRSATTGAGQVREITDYVSSTDTATIDPAWTTTPTGTIEYIVFAGAPAAVAGINAIADQVWDEVLSGHLTAGTTGAALNGAGSAGDPWGTALPGAYGAGTAGNIVGNNLNATVSSRASQASLDTVDDFLDTEIAAILADTNDIQTRLPAALVSGRMDSSVGVVANDAITAASLAADASAEIADAVWDEDATGHQTQGTFGQAIGDPVADTDTIWGLVNTNLNATVSSRASQTSVDTVDDFLDTEVAAILAAVDTEIANIQSRLPAALVSGRMDSSVGAMATGVITAAAHAAGAIDAAALATDAANEIRDAILAAVLSELGSDPGATPTLANAIMLLFMAVRNQRDTTATVDEIHNSAGTVILNATLSDDTVLFRKTRYANP